jgi:hypothetical protein
LCCFLGFVGLWEFSFVCWKSCGCVVWWGMILVQYGLLVVLRVTKVRKTVNKTQKKVELNSMMVLTSLDFIFHFIVQGQVWALLLNGSPKRWHFRCRFFAVLFLQLQSLDASTLSNGSAQWGEVLIATQFFADWIRSHLCLSALLLKLAPWPAITH